MKILIIPKRKHRIEDVLLFTRQEINQYKVEEAAA